MEDNNEKNEQKSYTLKSTIRRSLAQRIMMNDGLNEKFINLSLGNRALYMGKNSNEFFEITFLNKTVQLKSAQSILCINADKSLREHLAATKNSSWFYDKIGNSYAFYKIIDNKKYYLSGIGRLFAIPFWWDINTNKKIYKK